MFKIQSGLRLTVTVASALIVLALAFAQRDRADELRTDTGDRPGLQDRSNLGESSGIPIHFRLAQPGLVTLVIEAADGQRVRNLISETPFPAGDNQVWWDGRDDRSRDTEAAGHGVYHVPGKTVDSGRYRVRGLVRPALSLTYALNPYTRGAPPWKTADRGSEWLANHTAPSAILFVPAGSAPARAGKPSSSAGQVLVGSAITEGGSALAWLDPDGHKIWGQMWLGGVWTGATQLTRDAGAHAVAGNYAYAASAWPGDKYNGNVAELRLQALVGPGAAPVPNDARLGSGEDPAVLTPNYRLSLPHPTDAQALGASGARPDLSGLAAYNGLIIAALQPLNQLLFIDAAAHRVIGTAALPDPRGLAFDSEGRLLALSGTRLLRLRLDLQHPNQLPTPETLVADGLQDPRGLALDPQGGIYISDWGNHHQVLMFSADGRLLRSIGHAGAPKAGPYDANHMNHPAGLSVDDRGRLWVAENDKAPKRISLWSTADGRLLDAYYGPSKYGGGGSLDGADREHFYYGDDGAGIAMSLDWKDGSSVPSAVYYRHDGSDADSSAISFEGVPDYPIHFGNQLYLTNAFNSEVSGRPSAVLWRLQQGLATAVAAAGSTQGKDGKLLPMFADPAMQARLPAGSQPNQSPLLFIWSDRNGDGKPQAEEVDFLKPTTPTSPGRTLVFSAAVQDDLSFTLAYAGSQALRFPLQAGGAGGALRYDTAHPQVLSAQVQAPTSTGGGQILVGRDGWTVFTTPPAPLASQSVGGSRNGVPMWSYPSLWPGLHASHNAPTPEFPGELIGTTRVLGLPFDAPSPSDAGQLWAINGNDGTIYLFTTDGLFVATLFQDARAAAWDAPQALAGMDVSKLSLGYECFYPSLTARSDGHVYLQAGSTSSILELHGLEQIRRLPTQTLDVSADQLQRALQMPEASTSAVGHAQDQSPWTVIKQSPAPSLASGVADWNQPQIVWHTIDSRVAQIGDWGHRQAITAAAMLTSADTFYLAVRTDDPALLRNSGESLPNLFKTGGGIDLMLGSDPHAASSRNRAVAGDERLLVAQVNGKTVAVRYRAVAPGSSGPGFDFASPLRSVHFDRVDNVSNEIRLSTASASDGPGGLKQTYYQLEVPLATLGLAAGFQADLLGDVGVLRGNGFETLQRVYWRNRSSGLVSDVPSEAELTPNLWGSLHFGP